MFSYLPDELQSQIIRLRTKNDEQQEEYLNKFEGLQVELKEEKRKINNFNRSVAAVPEGGDFIDTQEGLKRKLQRVILVIITKGSSLNFLDVMC